jgi:hypothetical protein
MRPIHEDQSEKSSCRAEHKFDIKINITLLTNPMSPARLHRGVHSMRLTQQEHDDGEEP